MGWLDGLWSKPAEEDPFKTLDPKLRDFLEKESPVKFQSAKPPADDAAKPKDPRQTTGSTTDPTTEDAQTRYPSKTLYSDGRYADIWKTYKPIEAIEADTKSSHEKLMDVLDGYKERKSLIGRAALENCSFQQQEWRKCMLEGTWADTMTMCGEQVRKFERCYTMQSRFLRVLGYQAMPDRPQDLEEDIQLHADSLYQRMMTHEAAADKAREEGRPVPAFEILPPPVVAKAFPAPCEDVEKKWRDQLEKLPEEERPAEEAALRADYYTKRGTADRLKEIKMGEDAERRKRVEEGKATAGDHFWRMMRSGSGSGSGSGEEDKKDSGKGA